MCLYPKKTKKPSMRRVAWKVVGSNRHPKCFELPNRGAYRRNRTVECGQTREQVEASRKMHGNYGPGIHVFTTLKKAEQNVYGKNKIIKVQVNHKDWVAEGINSDALYLKVKVLT